MGDDEKMEEFMLPGFRFHPTDEELVSFYLKRKVQQRPLSVELIRQLDIYKYDPWDLPKFAMTCEKEWYFYCPRDRKYRNSARPNRVTGAGFWKATGTDRPIYSSDGSKCIGLKKSLVFYKGRAAKGVKTDWMMHEFRLPSLSNPSLSPKRFFHNVISPNDSWAICRIFKKTNPTAVRALSQSTLDTSNSTQSDSDKILKPSSYIRFHHENVHNSHQKPYSDNTVTVNPFSYMDFTSNVIDSVPFPYQQDLTSLLLSPQEIQSQFPKFISNDTSSSSSSSHSLVLEGYTNLIDQNIDLCEVLAHEQCPPLVSLPQDQYKENNDVINMKNTNECEILGNVGCPFQDFSSNLTTEEDHSNLKQSMLLESYYKQMLYF